MILAYSPQASNESGFAAPEQNDYTVNVRASLKSPFVAKASILT
jgi:hypothetical protein